TREPNTAPMLVNPIVAGTNFGSPVAVFGGQQMCAVDLYGTTICWGPDQKGMLGNGKANPNGGFVAAYLGVAVAQMGIGSEFSSAVDTSGALWWSGALNAGRSLNPIKDTRVSHVTSLAV